MPLSLHLEPATPPEPEAPVGPPSGARGALAQYRELPALSGRWFLPISFLGRLPLTMTPIAILALTTATTGSFATAGFATAATAIGTAVGAPLTGALADRIGQRPVLLATVTVNASALAVLALLPDLTRAAVLAVCTVIGLSFPQVGGMSRARWLALTRGRPGAALAYEGTADEVAYVLGPALVGVLASLFGPHAPVLVAAALVVIGVGSFAVHPTHAAPPRRNRATAAENGVRPAARRLVLRAALVPTASMVLIGVFFIAVQNALNAFAATTAHASSGGLLYALLAVGSSAMALAMAAVPAHVSARARCVVACLLMISGVAAMAASGTLAVLVVALLFAGLGIGPLLVTLHTVAGRRAPDGHGATVMALLSSGTVVGVALGALVAGPLAEAHGAGGAFAVAGVASVLVFSLTALTLRD